MPIDYKKYPANWLSEIRPAILRRAGNVCEWCGAPNGQPHPVTGSRVVLTIAHVHDPNPHNVEPSNLAALCQRCHLNHDRDHHIRNRRRNARARQIAAGQMSLFDEETTMSDENLCVDCYIEMEWTTEYTERVGGRLIAVGYWECPACEGRAYESRSLDDESLCGVCGSQMEWTHEVTDANGDKSLMDDGCWQCPVCAYREDNDEDHHD